MTDNLQKLLGFAGRNSTIIAQNSRYQGVQTAMLELEDGHVVLYLRRRFLPQPENFAVLEEHIVTEGERLDNITARYLSDPEQFWRLCDANRAMHPTELERIRRKLRITLPEGIPGGEDAQG